MEAGLLACFSPSCFESWASGKDLSWKFCSTENFWFSTNPKAFFSHMELLRSGIYSWTLVLMSHLPCGWDSQSLQLLDRIHTLPAAIFLYCPFSTAWETPSESTKLGSPFEFISKSLTLIAKSTFQFRKRAVSEKEPLLDFRSGYKKILICRLFVKIFYYFLFLISVEATTQ